jgi:YD repeat-containing protein
MGSQDFQYDRLSRLTLGEAATGGLEAIAYDSFGNIQSMNTGGVFQSTPTSATNNRLTLTGTTYDPAGNLTRLTLGGETFEYEYDGLSMMRSLVSNTDQAKVFLYNADDERFAIFECVSGFGPSTCASGEQRTLWYMRDLGGKVLRTWELQVELDYLGTPR